MKCSSCGSEAVYLARYSGAHYCAPHFTRYVEDRVRREIRGQRIFDRGRRIAVAVSGGKDSMTTLHILRKLSSGRRGTSLVAVTVDEGITGYRDECMVLIRDYCAANGIEWLTRSYREYGSFTMDMLAPAQRERSTCSYCGVFRRTLLNALARDSGADLIATGLNLDDTAQSILMNLGRGDADRLAMLGPHENTLDGLVPRVQPLRQIPENEVLLYALLERLPFVRSSCPYSEEASRNLFREMVLKMEEEMPGTRHAMLKTLERLNISRSGGKPGRCQECGDVTSGTVCRACVLRKEASALLGAQ